MLMSNAVGQQQQQRQQQQVNQLMDYQDAWRYQKVLLEHIGRQRKIGAPVDDAMLLFQHPSVYTLGRGATVNNLKFDPTIQHSPHQVHRIERGGEVTWHGPGQIVCYPILDLHNYKRDLHWYTTSLEESVIRALRTLGIDSGRSEVNTGVWIGQNKVCAIGITASRWVTMHGFALNVNCDLSNYRHIVPCGIVEPGRGVCSVQQHNSNACVESVAKAFLDAFREVFEVEIEVVPPAHSKPELDELMSHYPDIAAAQLDKTL